jgi:hypothetical protein
MLNDNEEKNKYLTGISQKRNEIENYLRSLDRYVYDAETKYLDTTQNLGNILKGWDQIFSTKPRNIPQPINPTKKTKFSNNERLFSQSSFNNNQLKDDFLSTQSKYLLPLVHSLRNTTIASNTNSLNRSQPSRKKKKFYTTITKKKRIHINTNYRNNEKEAYDGDYKY